MAPLASSRVLDWQLITTGWHHGMPCTLSDSVRSTPMQSLQQVRAVGYIKCLIDTAPDG